MTLARDSCRGCQHSFRSHVGPVHDGPARLRPGTALVTVTSVNGLRVDLSVKLLP